MSTTKPTTPIDASRELRELICAEVKLSPLEERYAREMLGEDGPARVLAEKQRQAIDAGRSRAEARGDEAAFRALTFGLTFEEARAARRACVSFEEFAATKAALP